MKKSVFAAMELLGDPISRLKIYEALILILLVTVWAFFNITESYWWLLLLFPAINLTYNYLKERKAAVKKGLMYDE